MPSPSKRRAAAKTNLNGGTLPVAKSKKIPQKVNNSLSFYSNIQKKVSAFDWATPEQKPGGKKRSEPLSIVSHAESKKTTLEELPFSPIAKSTPSSKVY